MREREQRLSGRNGRDGAGVEWETSKLEFFPIAVH